MPITLTRDFYTPEVVPPGSFISVQDFPSVKALAEYLLYFDKNDTAYNEYFTWKKNTPLDQEMQPVTYVMLFTMNVLNPNSIKIYSRLFGTMMFVAKKTRGNFYNL